MVRYNKANEIPVLKVPMQIIQCSTGTNPIYICHISKISLSMERITNAVKTSGALRERLFNDCLQLHKATYHERAVLRTLVFTWNAQRRQLHRRYCSGYFQLRRRHVHGPGSGPRLVHAPHTEHHDDADNTIQEIKRKHHHDVQCGEHVRGGDPTRVREHGDDVAGNTQNNNGSEADGVEHSK
nr:hypothetical protein Iba_scaffold1866CG1140 [Ipomoea batatas]GME18950.1 hypothetical protein Iba_scaffold21677CG0020 [Ipomoea batatas]